MPRRTVLLLLATLLLMPSARAATPERIVRVTPLAATVSTQGGVLPLVVTFPRGATPIFLVVGVDRRDTNGWMEAARVTAAYSTERLRVIETDGAEVEVTGPIDLLAVVRLPALVPGTYRLRGDGNRTTPLVHPVARFTVRAATAPLELREAPLAMCAAFRPEQYAARFPLRLDRWDGTRWRPSLTIARRSQCASLRRGLYRTPRLADAATSPLAYLGAA